MASTFYGDITHLMIEHRYYRSVRGSRGGVELVVYFVPRQSRTFEFVRMPFPARVITVADAQPVIEYEVSASAEGNFGGTVEGLTNVTVTCSPEFLAQAQISHSYLP
jgi:hypothetical protein